jgi:hypothetical protein
MFTIICLLLADFDCTNFADHFFLGGEMGWAKWLCGVGLRIMDYFGLVLRSAKALAMGRDCRTYLLDNREVTPTLAFQENTLHFVMDKNGPWVAYRPFLHRPHAPNHWESPLNSRKRDAVLCMTSLAQAHNFGTDS